MSPRKLWELCWLADTFQELAAGSETVLGLGVGYEPLIFHFAHLAKQVIATDLYSHDTAWNTARMAVEAVYEKSPFPYPRDRVAVRNMDMRRLEMPSESVDAVWSCSSVEHVLTLGQLSQIFREVHRVLKPGGLALITTEFSLGEPYFLPGVVAQWSGSALVGGAIRGLTLAGPIDLTYHAEAPGNRPLARKDVHRAELLRDYDGGTTGLCIHVGYTRLIPIALALRKSGPRLDWPNDLGAPAWYRFFARGVEMFEDRRRASAAVEWFRQALDVAETPGAILHCYRYLIEAHVHAGQVRELHDTMQKCKAAFPDLPADDDALDLIGHVAAGSCADLMFARRCWEAAANCPSALPASKFRIRLNQLEAELQANGMTREAKSLMHLAEAARHEAIDFDGADHPLFQALDQRFQALEKKAETLRSA